MIRTLCHLSVFSALALLTACRERTPTEATAETARAASSSVDVAPTMASARPTALQRVASSTVCMVNNRHMGSEQIPVPVNGRMYYGCCAGCKEKLETLESARTATDPVTTRPVDKASAVIARNAEGKVFYFENEETFSRYAQ